MGGILLLLAFLFCGVVLADALFCKRSKLVRCWLGLCAGLMLMMWSPVPFAYFMNFSSTAQLCGLGLSAGIALAAAFFNHRQAKNKQWLPDGMPLWLPLALVVPLLILSAYLQYTHILREVGTALHVGQSTYGDLCLHLGIATGLQNAAFPPQYTILPGALLGYPFLADSMVTSMLLFGGDLSFSFVLTGTLMMGLVYIGFILFAWELTHRKAVVVLAFVFMFINGGLGFLYTFDGVFKDPTMLENVFTGFYQTPTNMPDLNLLWVNVICDMMVPQRTLLTGWMALLPALYMLVEAVRDRSHKMFILLGLWAGLMPMVHTHSFFALGMLSAGLMVYEILHAPAGERFAVLKRFLCYGIPAVALALPQLLTWTFPQTLEGSSLKLRFNWVNNQGNGRLIDGYFWFWIKNVGLVYLFMLPAALHARRGSLQRGLSIGAAVIYTVAELVLFQTNPYDNNKLFYVAYMVMVPLVAVYLVDVWDRLKGMRGRALLATVFIGCCTVSGSLSLVRETISDYELFSAAETAAAAYIKENLPTDATFLTGTQHKNVVAALTGRKIVCGTGSYLYYHGLDYGAQENAVYEMLTNPQNSAELFQRYNVDYIYISDSERANYALDTDWFKQNLECLYDENGVYIYAYTPSQGIVR